MGANTLKATSVGAPFLPKKATCKDEELWCHSASAIGFLIRAVFRAFQWLQKEDNPFLKQNYAPVAKEVFQENLRVIEGAVPKDLTGTYIRTGPNPQHKPWGGYHWFDGEGMVHAVHFGDGRAKTYMNHWLRCKRFLYEKAAGCNLFFRFGDMKGIMGILLLVYHTLFKSFLSPSVPGGEKVTGQLGQTALTWHNGKLLALMEAGYPFLLRLCDGVVKSISAFTFEGSLKHHFTAHPKVDPKSGEMLSFAYSLRAPVKGTSTHVAYFSVSSAGHKGKSYPVDVQAPQMMHDFAITEKYAIFMDHSLIFDSMNLLKGGRNSVFRTDKSRNSRIGLLKRAAPEEGLQWFEVESFACFHTGAAWDDGNKVHLVISRYQSLNLDGDLSSSNRTHAHPVRYTMDVATGSITTVRLAQGCDVEFPVIVPHLVTQPAKFTYFANFGGGFSGSCQNSLLKISNTASKDQGIVGRIELPPDHDCGEFSVVPRASPSVALTKDEDDAWLVGYATDYKTMTSYCLVYDAQSMSQKPVAKVLMPQRVPKGFHGTWVHNEQLKLQDTCLAESH